MSGRFDPRPGEPYGSCATCGEPMSGQGAARAHMSETFDRGAGKSHGISVTNPNRADRIRAHVSWEISVAVDAAIETLDRLVDRGDASLDEIADALRYSSNEFSDAWDEYQSEADR